MGQWLKTDVESCLQGGHRPMELDELDRALLILLLEKPRAGLREHARTLGIARGTVTARFQRLLEAGVITGLEPHVSPKAFGYAMLAFVQLDISQGSLDAVIEALQTIPEVVEAYTVTGDGDVLCHVVAPDTEQLEGTIQRLIAVPGVQRTRSQIALTQRIPPRRLPLVRDARWGAESRRPVDEQPIEKRKRRPMESPTTS